MKGDLQCSQAQQSFLLALKYYLSREWRGISVLPKLTTLAETAFVLLIAWAGSRGKGPQRNVGMAYCMERWDECLQCLEEVVLNESRFAISRNVLHGSSRLWQCN